jgi:hypothetical protein
MIERDGLIQPEFSVVERRLPRLANYILALEEIAAEVEGLGGLDLVVQLRAEVERLQETLRWVNDEIVVRLRCDLDEGDIDAAHATLDDLETTVEAALP